MTIFLACSGKACQYHRTHCPICQPCRHLHYLFPTQPARGAFLWRHHFQLKKRTIIPFKNFCLTTAARGMGAFQPRTQHGPPEFLQEMPICFLATLSSGLLPPSRFVCNHVGDPGDEKTNRYIRKVSLGYSYWIAVQFGCALGLCRSYWMYLKFTVSIRSSRRLCSLSGMSKEVVNPD